MDLALGCDIRIASDASRIPAALTKRGVLPESGGTWLLPRIVGWSKACEIMFTGRMLSPEQCLEWGIVSEVVPAAKLMSHVAELAREITANVSLAVPATRRMMCVGQDETFEANVHHVYLYLYLQLLPLFRSKDVTEGVKSFLEKREPKFEGR